MFLESLLRENGFTDEKDIELAKRADARLQDYNKKHDSFIIIDEDNCSFLKKLVGENKLFDKYLKTSYEVQVSFYNRQVIISKLLEEPTMLNAEACVKSEKELTNLKVKEEKTLLELYDFCIKKISDSNKSLILLLTEARVFHEKQLALLEKAAAFSVPIETQCEFYVKMLKSDC